MENTIEDLEDALNCLYRAYENLEDNALKHAILGQYHILKSLTISLK